MHRIDGDLISCMTVALITGANKGLGRETARQLIAEGHTVYVGARNSERGLAAADELGGNFVQLDVTDDESVAKALAEIGEQDGLSDFFGSGIAGARSGTLPTVPLDRASVTQTLAEAGCIAAEEEADELMQAAAGAPDALAALVARRTRGEPVAWLTGAVTFCGVRVLVAPGVYVPRWQTEPLARRAAALLRPAGVAVDLCTGAGAIAAAMAATVPTARVLATELDENAVRCARRNGVEVFAGSLDDALPRELEHHVDVLTAVVPYVPTDSLRLLPRDVQAFEPRLALDGGPDGTDALSEVARRSTRWLRPGGWLLLELGGGQAEPMGRLLRGLGFEDLEVMADEDGDHRAICARLGQGG